MTLFIKVQHGICRTIIKFLDNYVFSLFQLQLMVNGESGDLGIVLLNAAPE